MRPPRAAVGVLATLALLLGAGATVPPRAPAAGNDPHQCGPQERWCIGALRKHGRRFLEIAGFELRGRYAVCVTPPGALEGCHRFTLTPNGAGAHASSVSFTGHFPHRRAGRYRVRWIYDGAQLGRVLRFSL
jgi:hypothetical protein